MAPKLNSQQCAASKVKDPDDKLYPDFHEDPEDMPGLLEYGYLQIADYRSQRRLSDATIKPLTTRWVPLPMGAFVHGYSEDSVAVYMSHSEVKTEPLRSCIRQPLRCKQGAATEGDLISNAQDTENWDVESSSSTVASSSECRRVQFPDGLSPGCWEYDGVKHDLPEELEAECQESHENGTLAEWVFIDRDICGYSLFKYAPDDYETKDFASSPLAKTFLREMDNIEFKNMYNQQDMMQCEERLAAHRQEERQLDKVLLLAGVHVNLIHASPEDEEFQEFCI
jgi:hypothetical protein